MTLYQFNQLDEMEQQEAIWEATYLADRTEGEFYIKLYQIDSFYVETYRHIENNVIVKYRSFASTDGPLKPYLDQIKPNL